MAAKKKSLKRKPAKVDTTGVEPGVPGLTAPMRQPFEPFKKKKKGSKKTK